MSLFRFLSRVTKTTQYLFTDYQKKEVASCLEKNTIYIQDCNVKQSHINVFIRQGNKRLLS